MASAAEMAQQREFAFSEEEFRFLAELVNTQTGIMLPEQKRDMVYARLARRVRALGLNDFAQYCELLQGDGVVEELGHLVNAITTNLTHFFREPHHFEHLRSQVLLPLAASGERRLRLWSADCSSGMEAYSIAMTVRAAIPDLKGWDARILATDIDTNMLTTGAAGEYSAAEHDNIPSVLRREVALRDERLHMSPALKEMIAFKYLNLLEAWPMTCPFDAVFCRNVVIYFDKETQRGLFTRMAEIVKPGGWLYIGHSENITLLTDRFELAGKTLYRRVA